MTPTRSDRDERIQPLPAGFGLTLDPTAKQLTDELWFGGTPPRIVRLTASGRHAWDELQHGPVASRTSGLLARRFVDAGLAHPVPPAAPATADVTVIVPVRDRVDELDRCLAAFAGTHPVLVVDDGSGRPAAIAEVAARHGARVVHRLRNGGPAAARNTGLQAVRSEVVAFVDSDCEPGPTWIDDLLGHLADPLVAAVAPRIAGRAGDSWSGRYTATRGSLDLGRVASPVAPRRRVTYVPTAALVVRRAALLDLAPEGAAFDETMRVGEDVDLVWRLNDAGWRVRYDPSVEVAHHEPDSWRDLLGRRFRYGTSAALLARRHPAEVAPLVLHPWPALTVAGLLARRPLVAAAGFTAAVLSTRRTLRRADVPSAGLVPAMGRAVHQTWSGVGRYATQLAAPLLAAAVLAPRRPGSRPGRRLAAASLALGPPLESWLRNRPALDPGRYVTGYLADEVAYGAGVLSGCIRNRTVAPARPVVTWRPFRTAPRTDLRRS